ncbi:MAG: hypothetical protein L6Q92_00640 [Phycisphaerae bacterium]|nr:hypothetical protein [Phycisphaerae bacterium]
MKRRIALSTLLLIAIGGCSSALVGTWKAADQPPEKPAFFIKQLAFNENGTYSASAKQGEEDLFLRGKYDFNGATLTLKPDGKAERQYRALIWWGRDLEITTDGQKQRLRKQ